MSDVLFSNCKMSVDNYERFGIKRIAFPWMGAMNGGIDLDIIQEITRRYLSNITNIDIYVYSFDKYASDPLFDALKAYFMESLIFNYGIGNRKIVDKMSYVFKNNNVRSFSELSEMSGFNSREMEEAYRIAIKIGEFYESIDRRA